MIKKVSFEITKALKKGVRIDSEGCFLSGMIKFKNGKFKKGGGAVYGGN